MWPFSSAYPEIALNSLDSEYDFIIIGGGTAGCVLANRLSADTSSTVLLVERGPLADTWASRVPLFSSDFASDGSRTLKRDSVTQTQLGRPIEIVSGKGLGGSTRVNQMIYLRGLPAEYDAWSEAGRKGWSWEELKPYFLKSEQALAGAVEGVHSVDGEWKNRAIDKFYFSPFVRNIEAAQTLNLPYIDDINSPNHPPFGCGRLHLTIDEQSRRHSAYHAFLPHEFVIKRPNLHICTTTFAEQIHTQLLDDGSALVTSVSLVGHSGSAKGERRTIRVGKEVVLASGPIGNPELLMHSGIGPADHLNELNIPVIKDLPAVGSNLQDHFGVSVGYNIPMKDSLVSLQAQPWRFFIELFRYLIWGTGLLLAPVVQLAIFTNSRLLNETGTPAKLSQVFAEKLPDIEILPMAYDSSDQPFEKTKGVYSFLNILLSPYSKGSVRLTSRAPSSPLAVDLAYLSDARDFGPLRAALKLTLRMCDEMRKQGYELVDWQVPASERDEDLDKWIRTRNRTTYHYSSTCRMAPEHDKDGGGVVDDELRVYGVRSLRIADSSIFPWVPRTHLQAPTVAVAEKCADLMLKSKQDYPLAVARQSSSSGNK